MLRKIDLDDNDLRTLDVDQLAERINASHAECEAFCRTTIDKARQAGDCLLAAKDKLTHGQFLTWLTNHCPRVSTRQAQKYMRLAREFPRLPNATSETHLTLSGALNLLASPRDETPVETGEHDEAIQILKPSGRLPGKRRLIWGLTPDRKLVEIMSTRNGKYFWVSIGDPAPASGGEPYSEHEFSKKAMDGEFVHLFIAVVLGIEPEAYVESDVIYWGGDEAFDAPEDDVYFPGYVPNWQRPGWHEKFTAARDAADAAGRLDEWWLVTNGVQKFDAESWAGVVTAEQYAEVAG